jgi:hypothetical protein
MTGDTWLSQLFLLNVLVPGERRLLLFVFLNYFLLLTLIKRFTLSSFQVNCLLCCGCLFRCHTCTTGFNFALSFMVFMKAPILNNLVYLMILFTPSCHFSLHVLPVIFCVHIIAGLMLLCWFLYHHQFWHCSMLSFHYVVLLKVSLLLDSVWI